MTDYDVHLIPPTHPDDIARVRRGTVTVTLSFNFSTTADVQEAKEKWIAEAMRLVDESGYDDIETKVNFWED